MSKEQAVAELVAATRKLVNCKGRFHTAQNYAEVVEALAKYEACSSAPGTPEAPEDAQRDAGRFRWIEENCRTEGGGHGFTVFVPVDHEDIGCGIDAEIQRAAQLDGGQEGIK